MSETNWNDLARWCEEAKDDGEPNFDLDRAIHGMLGNEGLSLVFAVPFYTRSLDAITALIERELPGHDFKSGNNASVEPKPWAWAMICIPHITWIKCEAATEPLARCAAFCRAMAHRSTPHE